MGQTRHHYERAFERHLIESGRSFISVNELRRSLLPSGHRLGLNSTAGGGTQESQSGETANETLKSFDFMVHDDQTGLLIDIKGRKFRTGPAHRARNKAFNNEPQRLSPTRPRSARDETGSEGDAERPGSNALTIGRLESWVTVDDVTSLLRWRQLFGPGYQAMFVFVYWCDAMPPAGIFPEMIGDAGRWYGVRGIELDQYTSAMRVRSAKWRTVHLSRPDFVRLSGPVFRHDDLGADHHEPGGSGHAGSDAANASDASAQGADPGQQSGGATGNRGTTRVPEVRVVVDRDQHDVPS